MARFGMGSILGAGAAGAYGAQQFSQHGPSGLWGMLPGNWGSSGANGTAMSPDVAVLQNELRRLTGMMGDMARNQSQPTVVHVGGSDRRGWTVLIVPTAVGGAALYIYCRFTGTSVWDLFFVSRSSLAQFRTAMTESVAKVWEELRRQKEELLKRVGGIMKKQEEMGESQEALMAKQDVMDARLRRVDETCYHLESKANHTINEVSALSSRAERMDSRLQDVHSGVTAANTGIYMLVSAVSEVTTKIGLHNSKTARALKAYAEGGPAWGGDSASRSLPSASAPPAIAGYQPQPAALPAPPAPPTANSVPTGSSSLGLRGVMLNSLMQASGPLPSSQGLPSGPSSQAAPPVSASGPLPSFSIQEESEPGSYASGSPAPALKKPSVEQGGLRLFVN